MANKIAIYAQIDKDLKDRITIYTTNSKILKKDTYTLNRLLEKALAEYMLNHIL